MKIYPGQGTPILKREEKYEKRLTMILNPIYISSTRRGTHPPTPTPLGAAVSHNKSRHTPLFGPWIVRDLIR